MEDPELRALHSRVKDALGGIPIHFTSATFIEGISAIDIFTLNTVLGAAIENQVVDTLNRIRQVWDPDDQYPLYRFVRQSQTFPDVLLKRSGATGPGGPDVLMGIELKGWYLIAKEGMPSFRYTVSPGACMPQDLLVVVPWSLNNVISGSPRVFSPFIESARYAAEFRNHHWTQVRTAKSDPSIHPADAPNPYPRKSDLISDKPASDGGGNFGRLARTTLMDAFIEQAKLESLCGISASHWLSFFKIFQDEREPNEILAEIQKLRTKVEKGTPEVDQTKLDAIDRIVDGIMTLLP